MAVNRGVGTWGYFEESTFVNIMEKEKEGNPHLTTFSRSIWSIIEQEFYEKTKRRYNHDQFINKYNQLRNDYLLFSKLLKQPGFTWDPWRQTAIAAHDVWESYLKTNKEARKFRTKGCRRYNKLVVIFGNMATDYKDESADLENESTNTTPRAFPVDSSSTDKDSHNVGKKRHRSPTPTRHLHRNKEAKTAVAGDEFLKETNKTTVSNKPADSVSNKTQMCKDLEGCAEPSSFSITNCVKCLESIQDVDEATYIKAIKMFKDGDWREMFMAMSAERRSVWLSSLE